MKSIPKEQILAHIKAENPWWNTASGLFSDLRERQYMGLFFPLLTNLKIRRAIVLMGPRRVGKTVLIHHAIQRLIGTSVPARTICYLSVDKPLYNGLSLQDFLELYMEATGIDYRTQNCFLFFDEIQYLREWEVHLKVLVDQYPTLRIVVSGSAAAALKLKSHESGAGRFTTFLLPPLTFHEYLTLLQIDGLIEVREDTESGGIRASTKEIDQLNARFVDYLNYGGYPEVALSEEIRKDPARFVKSDIIDKVLLRDLPSLYGLQDIQELNYLFTTLAFNTGNEVSLEELSQRSGVAKPTITRYIQYLEAAFLIRIVHRVDRNARRFRRANFFKVYLANPSMRTALFSPVSEDDEAAGAMVETAIYSQWFHTDIDLHYARWNNGEVDIVWLDHDQRAAWAVEVKWSDRYPKNPGDLKSLLRFCRTQNLHDATVTTKTLNQTFEYENVKLEFIPASLYCYDVGRNVVEAHVDGVTRRRRDAFWVH